MDLNKFKYKWLLCHRINFSNYNFPGKTQTKITAIHSYSYWSMEKARMCFEMLFGTGISRNVSSTIHGSIVYLSLYGLSISPSPPLAPSAFFPPIFAPLASLVSLSGIKTQLRKIHGNFLKVVSIRNGMQLEVFAIVESNSPLMNYNATI